MPHDCKQDDFPFGPLRSLCILNKPDFWPSTNWEMNLIFLVIRLEKGETWLFRSACQG